MLQAVGETNAAAILFGSGRAERRKFCSIMKWDIRNEFYPEPNKDISESEENFKVVFGVKVVLILCPAKKTSLKEPRFILMRVNKGLYESNRA